MINTIKILLKTTQNAALFVSICGNYKEDIDYKVGRYILDAKSFLGVLSASIEKEAYVEIHTNDVAVKQKFINDIQLWIVEKEG